MPQAVVLQSIENFQYRTYPKGQVVDFPAAELSWLKSRNLVDDGAAAVAAAIAGGAEQFRHLAGKRLSAGDVVVGDDKGDGLNANTGDSATISIARQIKAAAGRVTSILCTNGLGITLTLYDNAASAAGRQIYSGTLSAGDVVQPNDAWFAAGCFASFTGTAAFVINTSESAE